MKKNASIMIAIVSVLFVLLLNASASEQDAPAWSARQVPSEVVEAVVNGNLFVPNQRRKPRVEPPPGENDPQSSDAESDVPLEVVPEDPGRAYRLIGSSYTGGQWLAFIENLQTHEIHRVAVDQPIADGKIAAIDYNRIDYQVADETRSILIGRDLTGAEPAASIESELSSLFMPADSNERPSSTTTSSSGPSSASSAPANPNDADARRAEILRRLRERRERESQ